MNDTRPAAQQREFVPPRPTPVWSCSITLNTDFGQRVYKRAWDRLKADLYVLTVRTRSSGMDEAARAIETVISEAFESARKDLEAELARIETLMDSVKLTELPAYKGAQTLQAEYSTPRAKEFLGLIVQMDQLLMRYDALWLTGHIETHPRVQRSQNWQRRLIKIANRLRELGNRTRTGISREIDKRTEKSAEKLAKTAAGGLEGDMHAVDSSASHSDAELEEDAHLEDVHQPSVHQSSALEPEHELDDLDTADDDTDYAATPNRSLAASG
jgi:hypothetical protein